MGKLTLKIGRRRLSVPARVIQRAVDKVMKMPDSAFDFENPEIVIVTKRQPPRKKPVKKAKPKKTAVKKTYTPKKYKR